MPPGFFSSLKTAALSPYAFVAYVGLILAWAYIALAQHRLKRISKVINAVEPDERGALLAKEYSVFPRAGLSAEEWIRSRKHLLFFWAFLAVIIAVVVLTTIALTGKVAVTDDPKETVIADPQIDPTRIPKEMTDPLPNLPGEALKEELRRRGSLTLDNSTLTIGTVNAHATILIACYILRLQNGAKIVTNGNVLILQPYRLVVSGSGGIVSFPSDNKQAPISSAIGGIGFSGANGGRVEIRPLSDFLGTMRVNLDGQNGGRGGAGSRGLPGAQGAKGEDASWGLFGCNHGGGGGLPGFPGQPGSPGGEGGKGGDGGVLVLAGNVISQKGTIEFSAAGGDGGDGGPGGLGGPGGEGGLGGNGGGPCGGGPRGANGNPGPQGTTGTKGQVGLPGAIKSS